ncbi:MAG: thiamine biosynthesis protein ApbE [Chloroflexi bacterium RBG_13_57_8]|nr:MAG: thiamine biosynthesis protein ApbE [Chloroflexi bacterium RBG_13_57_8]
MKQDGYQPRTYRHRIEGKDLVAFNVTEKETDLYIRATSNLQRKAQRLVLKYRRQLESYIQRNPDFQTSLVPVTVPENAPAIVKEMAEAGTKAGVGPMAAVAGAIAECVGKELLEFSPEIIVENGGDIYLKITKIRVVGIYAGDSPLTGKVGLEINPQDTPLGVCTSSGRVGHSLSFGQADAAVTIAASAALADAAATAIGNRVRMAGDINNAIEFARGIDGLQGAVIILGENIGVWGGVKLCKTSR